MVRRVLEVVYKEVRGLHQAAYVLALFTFGSQFLALVRDRLLAYQFGAGAELDLYYAAFRIPDLLYVLFASALSVYVLIPFVAERIDAQSSVRARALLSQVFSFFVIAYTTLAVVIALAAPWLVGIIFPGFEGNEAQLIFLVRILLLQPFFLGISSLYGVITQLRHRFILYALSPLIYNVGIIFGVIFLYPLWGLGGLVAGVVLGAAGHLVIQIPFVVGGELSPRVVTSLEWTDILSVLRVSMPRALTLSLHQLSLVALVGLATLMAEGSVSVFQFAYNLQSVPLAIIGVSYSVAAFPLLAQLHAERKFDAFRTNLTTALRHIIFWSTPILALIIVVRAQFVRVVLGTGEFNWDDTRLTASVLALFMISLLAQAVTLLLVRALYATGNTRTPFYVTLASSIGVFVLSYTFYETFLNSSAFRAGLESLMRVEGVPGTEVLVLALGYTIALVCHAVVLMALSRKELMLRLAHFKGSFGRAFFAALCAGVLAYGTLNFFVDGLKTETLIGIFLQGLLATCAGLAGAIFAYHVTGSPEQKEVYLAFHKRIFRTDVIAPQDEDNLAV